MRSLCPAFLPRSDLCQGDIQDLGLVFSVTDDAYGAHKEVELFPGTCVVIILLLIGMSGGSKVEVTSKNRCASSQRL
jgi:hypothetical protein